jgi:hypothetical protein
MTFGEQAAELHGLESCGSQPGGAEAAVAHIPSGAVLDAPVVGASAAEQLTEIRQHVHRRAVERSRASLRAVRSGSPFCDVGMTDADWR